MGTEGRDGHPALHGRERECELIDQLLRDAAEGAGGALVLKGDAGIGKTALLDYAAARARGAIVLRTTGVEAEADLPFAGMYGLVRPVVAKLGELPERQSAAIAGALGLGPSVDADRLLVSAALLSLLAAAAAEVPVVCLVDDAQWLDKPSADALSFAARRLVAERVAILIGARESGRRRFDEQGLPATVLSGLGPDAAASLLATGAARAAGRVRDRLLQEAAGNPLALLELPDALSERELQGVEALPESIPLTPRLRDLFRRRLERLPEQTQMALMIAAADDTGEMAIILSAMAQQGLGAESLDAAEIEGLVRTTQERCTFRHPLVRAAVHDSATFTRRRQAHQRLAEALPGEQHADRRIWHQAMATITSDEGVAAALESAGHRARSRSAHASAATAYLRAADLSSDPARRLERLASAAEAAWHAGQPDLARDTIAAALPSADGELRAGLLHLNGVIESRVGSVREAVRWLLDAALATTDTSFQIELLTEANEAAGYAGDLEAVVETTRRQAGLAPRGDRDRFLQAAGRGWTTLWAGDHAAATAAFTEAISRAEALTDPRALVWAADAALAAFGFGAGLPYATRAVERVREQGLLSMLPMALHRQAIALQWNSAFDRAYATAEEGYRLALEVGYGAAVHLATMAFVEAAWGRSDDARAHAQEALAVGLRSGSNLLADTAELTISFVELTAGDLEPAADRLFALTAADRPAGHRLFSLVAVPDLIEVAARTGRLGEAAEPLERYRAWVSSSAGGPAAALLARCDAITAERDVDAAFGEALARAGALSPFERARTELLCGESLRRRRQRAAARAHLRTAAELFHSLGAVPWQERAEGELRATGETARKRNASTLDQLTPQEFQITAMVADGKTNREIAGQLFISPRTVDYHLRKVFLKLGIASRTELIRKDVLQRHLEERGATGDQPRISATRPRRSS